MGDTVVSFIEAVSEVKTYASGRRVPWPDRKRLSLSHYGDPLTPDEVLVLKAADVLRNVQSIRHALESQGLSVMDRFNGTADQTIRRYTALAGDHRTPARITAPRVARERDAGRGPRLAGGPAATAR